MPRLVVTAVALLAVAIAAPAAEAGRRSVKIKKPRTIAPGLSWTVSESATVDATLTMPQGDTMPIQERHRSDATIDVLDASAARIDRVRVTYHALPDGDPRSTHPYLIVAGTSAPVATAEDGRELAEEERQKLLESHGELVRRTPLRSWLAGKTFRKGKRVEVGDDAMADLFGGGGELRLESMTIALVRVSGGIARFQLSAQVSVLDAATPLAAVLDGTFEVDVARARLLAVDAELKLDGTVTSGGGLTFSVVGTAVLTKRWTYVDPA